MEYNTTNIQTAPDYSSATAIILTYFGLNAISALFLIAGIHLIRNLKTYEQAKNLFIPANTPSSSIILLLLSLYFLLTFT